MRTLALVALCSRLITVEAGRAATYYSENANTSEVHNATSLSMAAHPDDCNPINFVDLNIGAKAGLFAIGSKRKQAYKECEIFGPAHTRAETTYETKWLKETCEEGVDIGKEICSQSTKSGTDVPESIVNHFEESRYGAGNAAWTEFVDEWCAKEPAPVWTKFKHCHHACQFLFLDCRQWDTCKVCRDSPNEACDGARHKNIAEGPERRPSYNWAPKYSHTFLRACVEGCGAYVQLKGTKAGGPACKVGSPIKMMRTKIQQNFEHRCATSGGTLKGQVCMCLSDDAECVGDDGIRSNVGAPAQGCLENSKEDASGFMEGCKNCKCE